MPLTVDNLKLNKLYKKRLFMPTTKENKRTNAAMALLTPDYASSVKTLNLPFWINNHRYESYYIEKNITYFLSENGTIIPNDDPSQIIIESTISSCYRIYLRSKDELDNYGISYNEDLNDDMECMVFSTNTTKGSYNGGYVIMHNRGNTIYEIKAYSNAMRNDILDMIMILYDPKYAVCRSKDDKRFYKRHGFDIDKIFRNDKILVREEAVLTEGLSNTKLDMEIKFWRAQYELTKVLHGKSNDERWISQNLNKIRNKLTRIPLIGYVDQKIDETKESINIKISDQKATLEFYAAVKAIELKEEYDISEIVDEYVSWVEKLGCPKALKIKTLNTVIDAYEESIKECQSNLDRYRGLSDTKKRMENAVALSGKLFNIFGFITGGPLAVLKSTVLKGILPKSKKQNVLSEAELEVKISSYKAIVEVLKEQRDKIELEESALFESMTKTKSVPKEILELNDRLNAYEWAVYDGDTKTNFNKIDYGTEYHTGKVSDFDKHKGGTCIEYVNYQVAELDKLKIKHEEYLFLMQCPDGDMPQHTFTVFRLPGDSKYYYFESAWKPKRGIYCADSINDIFDFQYEYQAKKYGKNYAYISKYNASTGFQNITGGDFINKASNIVVKEYNKANKPKTIKESYTIMLDEEEDILPTVKARPLTEAALNRNIFQTEDSITFLEGNNEVLTEANSAYNAAIKRMLYSERIKNNKEILLLYDKVKEDMPWIKYTYITYDKYATRNLIVDWSYYTEVFFKKNRLKADKGSELFFDFFDRLLSNKSLLSLEYDRQTVIIPVDDWIGSYNLSKMDYKNNLNPISIIRNLILKDDSRLKKLWGNFIFIFTGAFGYMRIDFKEFNKADLPRFIQNIKKLCDNDPIVDDADEKDDSTDGIVNSIIDKIEVDSGDTIEINSLTGKIKSGQEEIKNKQDGKFTSNISVVKSSEISDEDILVANIVKAAETSGSTEDALNKLNTDDNVKQIVMDLRSSSPSTVNLNPTRVARVRKLSDEFRKKEIYGKSIEDILSDENDGAKSLPEVNLPIDTINDEWHHLKFANHDRVYDVNEHIVQCLYHFSTDVTIPVGIRDFNVENTSTSEDWVDTWAVSCEDVYGKRFTLKFDIPRFKNNNIMHLRGNDKTINNQLINLPVIKTEDSVCQMTSNYNKIFFRTYGTSTGKSCVTADRIIKTLNKMESTKNFEIQFGDNSRICSKYDLPLDYIDIASVITKITYIRKENNTLYKWVYYFNQDELFKEHGKIIDDKAGLCYAIYYDAKGKAVPQYYAPESDTFFSSMLADRLNCEEEFAKVYSTTNPAVRYTYSKASILNTEIPVAVMIGYYIGLIPMLDRLGVNYEVVDKRHTYDKDHMDIIKLSDAFIYYELGYSSSMLLNGLKECDLVAYSIKEVNDRKMWLDCLDIFGGRLRADGLDMFYDLMMDPITKAVCRKYKLPEDFIDCLLYSNMLLADNKYNKHIDITGNRYRSMECIAGYTYKALCNSYTTYRRDIRAGRDAKMSMKQSAVIDLLFADSTFGDLSALSDLLEHEAVNTTSFRGLSGMNSDRAYGLDKRTYDESMVNVLGLSTGFAANVGIARQNTIDMNIDSSMGYITKSSTKDMCITKTFCMTEALTPYGTTSDDPFRSAMTFIQTSKHGMRTMKQDPLLITNGADEALPYLTSNTFSFKAKNKGTVKIKTDEYMVLEYADKTTEVVDLREKIMKNSDGGMYIALKLDTDLKEGDHFRQMEIVANDRTSYSNTAGPARNNAFNVGTFVKCAILNSDEGFEDSCIETEWLSEAMASEVIMNKEYTLPKDTNVYFMAKKGDPIQEGEPLMIFQNAFDEEDANMLIKVLSSEDGDSENVVSELGRITLKSKVTGTIKDIKIYRTVDIEELSPSLKKIVTDYEKKANSFNKVLEKYDKDAAKIATATYKLEPTGKLKNAQDSVRVEFSLCVYDKFSVGDKAVCYSACKGVSKGVIAKGKEAYSAYRKDEKIHYIQCTDGMMARMVGSIAKVIPLNKVMVELGRQACDIMGIPWKYFDEY